LKRRTKLTPKFLLNDFIIKKYVESALMEDIGYGDITTDFVCFGLEDKIFEVNLCAREDGIFCGADVFKAVFDILSNGQVSVEFFVDEGSCFKKNAILAGIKGNPRYILTGERLALNFVQRMSGIASYTRKFADILAPFNISIADTRKNTPNFRIFEKYSALTGGARLHRFNLCDCIMLKDNHIALLGGDIISAVKKVKLHNSHAHKIEVECDSFEQVKSALTAGADILMLDNMDIAEIRKCVSYINKRAIVEISGNVKLENLKELANTGADIISTSAIITKAPALDLAFDYPL
ncbi:MAG: carboxylating nicotinate-nucleotide diphosphorylase, partial [Candidatus Gastranaerophilales bacterium]|nr:carboxylating nicotinate-nucleotide diphosphorylase [Candidatus Gastranaerophilales bacterium]